MELQTERLTLRKMGEGDIPDWYVLDQDREVRRFIDDGRPAEPWAEYQVSARGRLEAWGKYGADLGFWSARLADDSFVGWFHLRPNGQVFPGEMEIGYRLQRKFWRQGLATEGARVLLEAAFTRLGLSYVMATTLAANEGSRRVMEKLGMQFECAFVYPENLAPYWNEVERAAVKYGIRVGR